MAPRTPKIRLLRDKRRALDDQIVKLETELAKLRQEAKDFEIAERVLLSLGGDDEDEDGEVLLPKDSGSVAHPPSLTVAQSAVSASRSLAMNGDPANARMPRKPPDVPSTPEMIFVALKEMTSPIAASKTKTPLEIMEFIKGRWWPSVTAGDISPVVWRMANERRLFKDDAGYGLPQVEITPGTVRRFTKK